MNEILSNRSRPKFSYNGNLFCFHKYNSTKTIKFWRCDKRDSHSCKVRIHTSSTTHEVIKEMNVHSHGTDAAEIEVEKIRTSIKRQAETTQEQPAVILNDVYQNLSLAVKGKMPSQQALKKVIQRKRTKIEHNPAQPENLADLVIPLNYSKYENECFLLYDSKQDDTKRFLIFGRESHQNWSQTMKNIYMDGSFRITPKPFTQVYVIMAERNKFVFPVLYALLPDKTEETYVRLFNAVIKIWPQFNPDWISIDFERAEINAIRQVFPNASIRCCFFHLVKNMKKKLSEEGLIPKYNSNADFALQARQITAIAFIPPNKIEEALETLEEDLPIELLPILNWFEDNYIGRPNRRGIRKTPLFPCEIWNVFQRTLNGESRTNNYVEANHRKMQNEFGVNHPTIWKFIDGIKKIQSGRDKLYEEFVRGEEPSKKRKKYIKTDQRILKILTDFQDNENSRTLKEYLRGIALNFLMN